MTGSREFGVGRVTRFYVPLLLQAFSQSLTYPLVAGIVTHGAFGVDALTAFSQGQMIMFMIGSLGGGLVTTGMVFAKTWNGYFSFRRLNAIMMAALLALQCVPALPPFDGWVFEGIFALPPELAAIARRMLVLGAVMNGLFFLRNVPMVVLFNNYESGKANLATFSRILVTLGCSTVFVPLDWTGPDWGLFALTLGVGVEYAITWACARPFVRELRETTYPAGGLSARELCSLTLEQFRFTLPLSLGGCLLMVSPLLIAAFVGRSADAQAMLAVHYVTIGVANPVGYAALRMQTVAIQFPPEYRGDRRLLVYAVAAGAVLGIVPFLFSLPSVGTWYFHGYQNLPLELLPTARTAVLLYSGVCITLAVRGRIEGLAAKAKRPGAVMAGQITYTVSLLLILTALSFTSVPGWVMAVVGINAAPLCATAAIYATVRRGLSTGLRL